MHINFLYYPVLQ